MFSTQQRCTLPFTSKLRSMHAPPPPNRSQIKRLLFKTLKSLFCPSNPKYACHIQLTCSHLCLWMNFVKQDSSSNNNVYCPMNQTCPNQPLFACTFIVFSNLFMWVAWGIQVHKLLSFISQSTWNIWKLLLFQFCCSHHKHYLIVCKHAQSTFACLMEFNPTTPHAYFFYTK
jgi:hypothetical protein